MSSLGYHMVEVIMKLSRKKVFMSLSPEEMKKRLKKNKKEQEYRPFAKLYKRYCVKEIRIDSNLCYIVSPHKDKKKTVILFIHGGAYVKEMNTFYWEVIAKLVDELSATIYIPIYPLAPEHTYCETMKMLPKLYQKILEKYANNRITIMGDSAGGQIGLSFCQQLNIMELLQPKELILISPILEMFPNFEHLKKMKIIEKKDCMLSTRLFYSGIKWWTKNASETDYLINPMRGDMKGLPTIVIFSGTNDILNTQVQMFIEKVREVGGKLIYIKGENMMHIWPYIPRIKESENAFKQIVSIIKK